MRLHVLVLASVVALPLAAQEPPVEPVPGQRVRVRVLSGERIVGKLTATRVDALLIDQDGIWFEPPRPVVRDSIHQIDVSRGRYVSGKNVTVGILAGIALGIVTLLTLDDQLAQFCVIGNCEGPGNDFANAVILGASAGLVVGLTIRADRWEAIAGR